MEIPPFSSLLAFTEKVRGQWEAKSARPPIPHTELLAAGDLAEHADISLTNALRRLTGRGFRSVSPEFRLFGIQLNRAALWLTVWAMAASMSLAADTAYTVRRGDTLYGIARNHGLAPAALAERNGLSKSYHIYAGQRLVIPIETDTSPPLASALPVEIQVSIETASLRIGRWKRIVIHHSGVDTGTMKGMDRYHRDVRHMENGLAYHFVIGNGNGMGDGEIGVGSRWAKQLDGGHLASESQNKASLGVCLVGNFDKGKPTPEQMRRLTALVHALLERCQLPPSAVRTHQQVNVVYTRCPGRYFPTRSWLKSLKASALDRKRTKS
jgi:LysM repeat protein